MMGKIILNGEIEEFGDEVTKVKELFVSDVPDISIAEVIRNSEDKSLECDKNSDNFYYVVEGRGFCLMGGKENPISKGDLIIIPKGTKYKNIGKVKLLAISLPKFKMENHDK